jgi:hypothetical protein
MRFFKGTSDRTLAHGELPSCALDENGMQEQRARHARLARSVIRQEHLGESVRFTFASDLDRAALAEMVAVEEQCCPFFKFSFAETERQLLVTVSDQEMLPALEAIASALRAGSPSADGVGR